MAKFHKILTDWYQENKRDLPWRENKDPYFVWISEIILQQTRVDQGIGYFLRFKKQFPTIKSLASAQENDVLKIWQGLGYYSRARNIHFAAQQIVNEHNDKFPNTYDKIIKLKGVGDYTASAIASIAFGLPHAAIDGNVYRVLSRIFGIKTPIDSSTGKKEFRDLADQLIDSQNPGNYNEALMEFGALQCTPKNPVCRNCPFQNQCIALSNGEINALPVKSNKIKIRHRYFNYLYIRHKPTIYLEKREGNDIWQNLFQLPLIESEKSLTIEELLLEKQFQSTFDPHQIVIETVSKEIIHLLSHQKLHVKFIEIALLKPMNNQNWIMTHENELGEYPLPKVITNFLMDK